MSRPLLITCEGSLDIEGLLVQWTADCEVIYAPGRFWGPPESCYPDESECWIVALNTHPAGFEGQVPDEIVEAAAWEQFERLRENAYA